jgi:DNA-directed RNA polymerase beta subunit
VSDKVIPPNEIKPDYLSIVGLNPWPGHDSSSRVQMFSSHLAQKLVVKGMNQRRCQTGLEAEFGKYTFSVKMPVDATVIKPIERYRQTIGRDSIAINPQTVVLYEDNSNGQIGCINLTNYCSYHQYFGFEYKKTPEINKLSPGQAIPKDTVFLDSPGKTKDGNYMYGVELNMAFMSHPAVAEDGIVICEDVLDKLSFKIYETRVVEFGSSRYPLNLYGTVDNFKSFPEIGERIRSDGILMALRQYDKNIAPVEQSIHDLMEVDMTFDRITYGAGPGGKIVDIRVYHDDDPQSPTPLGMDGQIEKYLIAKRNFYSQIVDEYKRLKKARGDRLSLTPELHRLVVEALGVIDNDQNNRLQKLYRKSPLDDYRLEFVIEYEIKPNIGYKISDLHGGKGVVVHIAKPDDMPVDEAGNRADIIMDGNSTVSRMNLGRLYEHFINATSRDVTKGVINILGVDKNSKNLVSDFYNKISNDTVFNTAYNYLLGYYEITSPRMFDYYSNIQMEEKQNHLLHIVKDGVYLYIPTDNPPDSEDIISEIQEKYPSTYGPVTYKNTKGQTFKTKTNVRIASVYMILLEKIGDDWAAVSSGKLQNFGILSQLTKSDKYNQPTRNQAVRAIGETEARIFVSYCGQPLIAELMDRNNNPITHKNIVWNILTNTNPSNIDFAVDRTKIGYGGAKPLQLVNHIALCGGFKFTYKPEALNWNKIK